MPSDGERPECGFVSRSRWQERQVPTLDLTCPEDSRDFIHIHFPALFLRQATGHSVISLRGAHRYFSLLCFVNPHSMKQLCVPPCTHRRDTKSRWWGWFCPQGLSVDLLASALSQGPPLLLGPRLRPPLPPFCKGSWVTVGPSGNPD